MIAMVMMHDADQHYVAGCLNSLAPYVDKVYLYNNGSKDYSCKGDTIIYKHEPWQGEWDYGAARNKHLQWIESNEELPIGIITLDADERLEVVPEYWRYIKDVLGIQAMGLGIQVFSPHRALVNIVETAYSMITRIWWHNKPYRYVSSIHETISGSIQAEGGSVKSTHTEKIRIVHLGYDLSKADIETKIRRNLTMILDMLSKDASQGFAWALLGRTLSTAMDFDGALSAYDKALELGLADSDLKVIVEKDYPIIKEYVNGQKRNAG